MDNVHSSIPEAVAEEYPLALFPEEIMCRDLILSADVWQEQVKKITQNYAVKRGVPLSKVLELYEEGTSILFVLIPTSFT